MRAFYRRALSLASMAAMTALELTLLYLLAAVLGVVACRSLKLPPMLGYLAVGVVIGPNALALSRELRGCAPPGRVRRGVPDVRDRAGVQPGQAALDAQPRVRARPVAGCRHHAAGHAGHLGLGLADAPALGHELADRAGTVRRPGHEQHGHRGQADGRAAGAGVGTRQTGHGRVAVPGSGRGAAAGADSGAGRLRREHWPVRWRWPRSRRRC